MSKYAHEVILSFLHSPVEKLCDRRLTRAHRRKYHYENPIPIIYCTIDNATKEVKLVNANDHSLIEEISHKYRIYISAHGFHPEKLKGKPSMLSCQKGIGQFIDFKPNAIAKFLFENCPEIRGNSLNKLRISLLTCYGGNGRDNNPWISPAGDLYHALKKFGVTASVSGRMGPVYMKVIVGRVKFTGGYLFKPEKAKVTFTSQNKQDVIYYDKEYKGTLLHYIHNDFTEKFYTVILNDKLSETTIMIFLPLLKAIVDIVKPQWELATQTIPLQYASSPENTKTILTKIVTLIEAKKAQLGYDKFVTPALDDMLKDFRQIKS